MRTTCVLVVAAMLLAATPSAYAEEKKPELALATAAASKPKVPPGARNLERSPDETARKRRLAIGLGVGIPLAVVVATAVTLGLVFGLPRNHMTGNPPEVIP